MSRKSHLTDYLLPKLAGKDPQPSLPRKEIFNSSKHWRRCHMMQPALSAIKDVDPSCRPVTRQHYVQQSLFGRGFGPFVWTWKSEVLSVCFYIYSFAKWK